MTATAARVIAVVVTHHPDVAALARLHARLAPQVAHTIEVDNSEGTADPAAACARPGPCTRLRLGHNHGLGHAQNLGLREALALGATHVLLLDQDSLPPANLVTCLLAVAAQDRAGRVAAIAPLCRDVKTGQVLPLIQRRGLRIHRRVPAPGERAPVPVAYMPASGTLVPRAMLERVGPMREAYFIDRIDVEWCLRATRLGLTLWVTPEVELAHDMGTRAVQTLGRTLYLGQPLRAYFHVRNSLAMALRAPIPWLWRLDQLLKTPAYLAFYSWRALPGQRAHTVRLLLRALVDGLCNRLGPGPLAPRPRGELRR